MYSKVWLTSVRCSSLAQVQKYEAFLNDRLKSDLKKALERRDSIYEEISEYTKLATMIETIKVLSQDVSSM